MRLFWFLLLVAPVFFYGEERGQAVGEEEALFLRRISEFWQEGEYQIAKGQIEEFIAQYPNSFYADALCSALGDLFLREKNYSQALGCYSKVREREYLDKIFLNRMQCLYELQWYATLADECEAFLQTGSDMGPDVKLHVTYFLGLALYQQCLNLSKEPEALLKLAKRAQPHFETLFKNGFSSEAAQGFAYLCCILKEFPKAAQIYLELAEKDPSAEEEMLFHAALVQTEYDKEGALGLFDRIAKMGQSRAKEAAFNRLVLAFETGKHADLAAEKETLLKELPAERAETARLFLGRSLLALKRYSEALAELQTYFASADETSPHFLAALISLTEAAYNGDEAEGLSALDFAIEKLSRRFPNDPELPKAYFSRAQLLKKNQRPDEAQKELRALVARFPHFGQKAQALFELAHMDHQRGAWAACRETAQSFLSQFPEHELAPFAWRYLLSASSEIAVADPGTNPGTKEGAKAQFASDLASLLAFLKERETVFPVEEAREWQFLYAKTLVQIGNYKQAEATLQPFLDSGAPHRGDASLLLAFCYRDGDKDPARFCEMAEKALALGQNLMAPEQVALSLFNSYLEQAKNQPEQLEQAAHHLFKAFERKAPIDPQNRLWLADFYSHRLQNGREERESAERAVAVLESLLKDIELNKVGLLLAKAYAFLNRTAEQIALLEKMLAAEPSWPNRREAELLLAEGWVRQGEREKALQLFREVAASSPTLRDPVSASAALQHARLKIGAGESSESDFAQIASQLKTLVLQRTLSNEPVYLEAALAYIDLQAQKTGGEKRLALLEKAKADFERTDDLLSKDYQAARAKLPKQDKIYQGYIHWFEAEILLARAAAAEPSPMQKELQANAKRILLQVVDEKAHPSLAERACLRLKQLEDETPPKAKA